MAESFATVPAVWMLVFDQYPAEVESIPSGADLDSTARTGAMAPSACQTGEGVFDRLDLTATFFEQFMLQDIRTDVQADDVFGGEPAFLNLAEEMTAAGQVVSLLSLKANGIRSLERSAGNAMEMPMRRSGMPLDSVTGIDCYSFEQANSLDCGSGHSDQAFSASLVWIEANTASSSDSAKSARRMLEFVLSRLESDSMKDRPRPVLMVTFRKGDERLVQAPLKSTIAEHRMHVPLWIQTSASHTCRVQALAGSFDLVPTIASFLSSACASNETSPPLALQLSDSAKSTTDDMSARLPSEPRSLTFLCGAPQVCPDRLLTLHGDGWKAARTEEFLFMMSDNGQPEIPKTESDGHDSEESLRRLFVKPEDRFNINDVSGTYATVADNLRRLMD